MTMPTTFNSIAIWAITTLLLITSFSAQCNCGFNIPHPDDEAFYYINKSKDGNNINDLRGYPNSQPILKLENTVANISNGSLSFNESPQSINCLGNINFTVPSSSCEMAIIIDPPSSDCTISNISYVVSGGPSAPTGTTPMDPSGTYQVGTYTITWTVTDCDGTDTCIQTVSILDMTGPVVTCPNSLNLDCDTDPIPGTYTSYAEFLAAGGSATDNCAINPSSFQLFLETNAGTPCNHTITRTYRISDVNNQMTLCTRSIFVNDGIRPTFTQPADITLSCDQDPLDLSITGDVIDEADNCSIGIEAVFTDVNTLNTCGNTTGTITRTWTLTDDCGNERPRTQIITIQDIVAPSVDCSSMTDLILECDGDYTAEIDAWLATNNAAALAGATDLCSGTLTVSNNYITGLLPSMSCDVSSGLQVTFMVFDQCSNMASCTAMLILDDNTAPLIDCSVVNNLVLECDGDYTTEINAWIANTETAIINSPSTVDLCSGSVTISNNYNSAIPALSCDTSSGELVTFTVVDGCMNSASCTASILITDTTAPQIIGCPDDIMLTTETNNCTVSVSLAVPTSTDACTTPTITNNITAGADASGIYGVGTTVVTWTSTDACGNTATCSTTVIVEDQMPPIFSCPSDLTAACDSDEQVAYTSYSEFIAASGLVLDNCQIDEDSFMFLGEVSDGNTCPEIVTRSYQIADIYGNENTCSHMVVVNDLTAPSINCASDMVLNTDTGLCGANVTIATPVPTDNCGIQSITNNFNDTDDASGFYPTGINTVVWTVTDLCGNTNTCSFTITVNDIEIPTISCPISLNTSCSIVDIAAYANVNEFEEAGGTLADNCNIDTDSFILLASSSDASTCPETITRTYQISDTSGNTATCTQSIIVNDETPPTLTCGLDITVNATAGQCNAMVTIAIPVPTDNCGTPSLVNDFNGLEDASGLFPVGTTTVTWTATDLCLNNTTCAINVTVNETENPTLTCPPSLNISCDISEQPAHTDLTAFLAAGGTASDNCALDEDSFTLVSTTSDGNTCPEIITRVYQVSDVNGNNATCSQIITINDITPPTINCASDITVNTDTGVCNAMVSLAVPTTSDNCQVSSLTNNITGVEDASGIFNIGTTTIIWTVTDLCGNSTTCEVMLTVEDNENPTITCPLPLSASCSTDVPLPYADMTTFLAAGGTVSDNCDIDLSLSVLTDVSNGASCPETITRTYVVTDDDGNTASCQQLINVDDQTNPTIVCPLDIVMPAAPGTCQADVTIPLPTVSDNCGIDNFVNDFNNTQDASGTYQMGTTSVTYTVTDNCGNIETCSFDVTITDTEAPSFTCDGPDPKTLTFDCNTVQDQDILQAIADVQNKIVIFGNPTDNCDDNLDISNDYDGVSLPDVSCLGSNEGLIINVIATDDSGNSASCAMILQILDLSDPIFDSAPAPIDDITCTDGFPAQEDLTTTDCTAVTIVKSTDPYTEDQCNGYAVTYRWTATDECNNSSEVTQTFNVLPDTDGPVFDSTPLPIDDINCDEPYPTPETLTAMDACQNDEATVMVSVIDNKDQCNGYTVTYLWTATDNCGNSSTTSINFDVLPDIVPPVFDSQPSVINDIDCGENLPTPEILTATDACQDNEVNVVFDIVPFTEDQCNGYTITYRWTATDNCNNSTVVTQDFAVLPDTEAPVFDSQPQAIDPIFCNDPLPTPEILTATDACQDNEVSVVFSMDNFNINICSGYQVTYRWTATDNCNNSSQVSVTFEILPDTQPPVFDMEAPMIGDINCDDPFPLFPVVTATDNCDNTPTITTMTLPVTEDQCGGFPVTYQWTATDDCGNTATITSIFNVRPDTQAPVFDNQPTTIADINCQDDLPIQETLTATDACGVSSVVASVDSYTVDVCGGYDITYRWVATDACNNSSTVTETFSVLPDTEGPIFDSQPTAIANISCNESFPIQETLTAQDLCSTSSVVASVDDYTVDMCNGYTVTYRWVATDACLNSTVVTSSFDILPDTEAPVFDNAPSVLADIACNGNFPVQETLTAKDNCNTFDIIPSIDPYTVDQCNGYTVTYRWVATDQCGNSSEVMTSFDVMADVEAPVFDNVPTSLTDINCNEAFPTQETLTATDNCGDVTVVPSVDPYTVDICGGYAVTYRWVATDACGFTSVETVSFNVLSDTQSPVVSCQDITVGTDDGVCQATLEVPAPPITDDCSTYTVTNSLTGTDNADGVYLLGDTSIEWTVTDACNNIGTCTQIITIVDDESPSISCVANLTASIENNGLANIPATDFITMATDNCGTVNINVRRLPANGDPCGIPDNTTFRPFVTFCCADATSANGEVMVEVRVDDGNGNETNCMVTVQVNDNIAPSLVPPSMCLPDITISCEFPLDTTDLSVFGDIVFDITDVEDIEILDTFYFNTAYIAGQDALYTDNCLEGISVLQTISGYDTLVCNQGTFSRTLLVTDLSGNTSSCVQMITIDDVNPFSEEDITWPEDYEIKDCTMVDTDPNITGNPILVYDNCSLPGPSYTDQVFDYPLSGCQLIQRTWRVLDWCQYVPNSGSDLGVFTHVQNIIVTNSVAPTFTITCADTTICSNELTCLGDISLTATATDDCTPASQLYWTHSIDLFGLGENVITHSGNILTGTYPRGTHVVTWTVEDRCGNVNTCSYNLTIRDCKAPQIVCKHGLSTSLIPMNGGGMVQIWANDFVQHGADNCTLVDDLIYSFSADIDVQSLIFTCNELGKQEVEVWSTDEDGNQSFCVTYIDIQDNASICQDLEPIANVSGVLRTSANDGIENAEVTIESSLDAEFMMSEFEGEYAFIDVPMYNNYEISPFKNDDPMNGVSTLDLLIIQKHILAIQPIDDPYQLIAADVNGSGHVSAIDLIELRKLILGVLSEFPNNTSWRFVDEKFEFNDPTHPWPFVENVVLENLSSNQMETNFIGVKVGDVNGNAQANYQGTPSIETRSDFKGIKIMTDNISFDESDAVSIPLKVQDFKNIHGLQLTIDYNEAVLEYKGYSAGDLVIDQSNINNGIDGKITLSWNDIETKSITDGNTLINVFFNAKVSDQIEGNFTINSSITQAEVYNNTLQTGKIHFELSQEGANGFELLQNSPNPFKDGTDISFVLPRDMNTSLIIYDGAGKLIYSQRNDYKQGLNTISIKKADLKVSTGVLFYKLKAENYSQTRQMLLIE